MWESLLTATALLFVLEGFLPFLYPGKWRHMVELLAQASDKQLRFMGFISMLIGAALLHFAK